MRGTTPGECPESKRKLEIYFGSMSSIYSPQLGTHAMMMDHHMILLPTLITQISSPCSRNYLISHEPGFRTKIAQARWTHQLHSVHNHAQSLFLEIVTLPPIFMLIRPVWVDTERHYRIGDRMSVKVPDRLKHLTYRMRSMPWTTAWASTNGTRVALIS